MKKEQIIAKINYLEDELTSLEHYLPETYEYLMAELDVQRRMLAEIEVSETFQQIEQMQTEAITCSRNQSHQRPSYSRVETRNKKGLGT
jgi:hypothetical protein